MPFQAAPGIMQAVVKAQESGQDCFSVFNAIPEVPEDPITYGTVLNFADELSAAWEANVLPLLGSNYVIQSIDALDLSVLNGAAAQVTPATSAGTRAAAFSPNNVSLAVRHRTGVSGRSYNGRTFWPSIPTDMASNNIVNAGYISDILDAFVAIKTALDAAGIILVVLSRVTNKAPRAVGIGTPIINFSVADNVVDSMSRRLPKRGK